MIKKWINKKRLGTVTVVIYMISAFTGCLDLNSTDNEESLNQVILWSYANYSNAENVSVSAYNPFVEISNNYKRKLVLPYCYDKDDVRIEAKFFMRRVAGTSNYAYAKLVLYEYDIMSGNGIGQNLAEAEARHNKYELASKNLEINLSSLFLVDSLAYLIAFEMRIDEGGSLKPKSLVSTLVLSKWEISY